MPADPTHPSCTIRRSVKYYHPPSYRRPAVAQRGLAHSCPQVQLGLAHPYPPSRKHPTVSQIIALVTTRDGLRANVQNSKRARQRPRPPTHKRTAVRLYQRCSADGWVDAASSVAPLSPPAAPSARRARSRRLRSTRHMLAFMCLFVHSLSNFSFIAPTKAATDGFSALPPAAGPVATPSARRFNCSITAPTIAATDGVPALPPAAGQMATPSARRLLSIRHMLAWVYVGVRAWLILVALGLLSPVAHAKPGVSGRRVSP